MEIREFIITIFTENSVGVLGRITTIFTRRKINIESLKVSETPIKGISMFTISTYSNESTIKKVVKNIERIIEVFDAHYNISQAKIDQQIEKYKNVPQEDYNGVITY